MEYNVVKVDSVDINARWDKNPWDQIPALLINSPMGGMPDHFPEVKAKLAYNDEAIFVIFHVRDQYVRAVAENYQDKVYEDSCVEFFFTPGSEPSEGYFNLEMNCGGKALFHFQKVPRKDPVSIDIEHFKKIKIAHSLPSRIETEIKEPVEWIVEYRIPYNILKDYFPMVKPRKGIIWRANLYKCADKSSHPHWLTWAEIDFPKPDFHQPGYFGILRFD